MPQRCAHFVPVCLVCTATLGGHFFIARKLDARRDQPGEVAPLIAIAPPSPDEVTAALPEDSPDPRAIPRLLATLGYETLAAGADGPADALQPVSSGEAEGSLRPLSRRQREDQDAVREVIDEELSEASAEERDIWFEELKSLPAEVVRDLLQVRQQMRVLSPDHPLSRPAPLAVGATIRPREIVAEPVTQSRPMTGSDWSDSRVALETAIDWATHNIANAQTIGYKRVEVALADVIEPASELNQLTGRGCRLASIRLDVSQGELIDTGRSWDVAIDGPGFFVIGDDESSRRYTRRGMLGLDTERRLCIAIDQDAHVLQPGLTVPENVAFLEIAADGTVSALCRDAEAATAIGQIQLAVFDDAGQLMLAGGGTYVSPTLRPQLISPGEPGAGVVCQGFLEPSNVDIDLEVELRERWETMLGLLPRPDVPRTAGNVKQPPR